MISRDTCDNVVCTSGVCARGVSCLVCAGVGDDVRVSRCRGRESQVRARLVHRCPA